MAPKKKAAAPKPAAPAAVDENGVPVIRRKVSERDMFLTGAPPWEDYGKDSLDAAEGLAALVEDGETEVLIGTIEQMANGQMRSTTPRLPGAPAALREEGPISWTREGKPLQEAMKLREDAFSTGSEEGGRVVFSADAFYYILLTDDMKYRAMQQSYKYFREDPMYRCAVMNLVNYVMGGSLKFEALDEDPSVNQYVHDFWKINKMHGKDREIVIRWFLTGEVAVRFYPKGESTGGEEVAAQFPAVRLIPFWRLAEVLKDNEDAEVVVGFKVWQASGPYRPQVKVEDLKPEDMVFWKNSTPEEDRGEPPLLALMRPCKWYQDWINNRVILNRFRSAFVLFKKITQGTPGKVASVSSGDPAATQHTGVGGKLEKRLPKLGSVVTHNDKIEYEFKSPNLGASDAGEDGRKIVLYGAAAAQLPEFIFGDASNANLASTMTAENPFIRSIEAHRTLFEGVFGELFRRAIEHGIKNKKLKPMSTETTVSEGYKWVGKARKLFAQMGLLEAALIDDDGQVKKTRKIPTRTDVKIDWPNLIHVNQLEDAQAAQAHQGMGLVSKQTLRGKMGYDHEVELERLDEERAQDLDEFAENRQAELDAAGGDGDPGEPAPGARQPLKKGGKGATGPGQTGVGKP